MSRLIMRQNKIMRMVRINLAAIAFISYGVIRVLMRVITITAITTAEDKHKENRRKNRKNPLLHNHSPTLITSFIRPKTRIEPKMK